MLGVWGPGPDDWHILYSHFTSFYFTLCFGSKWLSGQNLSQTFADNVPRSCLAISEMIWTIYLWLKYHCLITVPENLPGHSHTDIGIWDVPVEFKWLLKYPEYRIFKNTGASVSCVGALQLTCFVGFLWVSPDSFNIPKNMPVYLVRYYGDSYILFSSSVLGRDPPHPWLGLSTYRKMEFETIPFLLQSQIDLSYGGSVISGNVEWTHLCFKQSLQWRLTRLSTWSSFIQSLSEVKSSHGTLDSSSPSLSQTLMFLRMSASHLIMDGSSWDET